MSSKLKVSYFHDPEIGLYHYSNNHYMKPFRVAITDELIRGYGMDKKMTCYDKDAFQINQDDLEIYHAKEYVEFLRDISPENQNLYEDQLTQFNFGVDCPVFTDLYDYCCLYTSGSIFGAQLLNENKADIAINWSGGLHHAKKCEASGFCYINDCVLAILELLKKHQKVLYIDIDVHHGDGVEEAFYTTNRVMTLSFHKFGDFFPGTGHVKDKGVDDGSNHSINFPLKDGIDDFNYAYYFRSVLKEIMEKYDPGAVVLQSGADSMSGDRLGCFNLSAKGHASALECVKEYGKPICLIGGGGYTLRNVPRCWTYETSIALDMEIPDQMPENDYLEYFGPEYRIHMPVSNMENQNSKEYLDGINATLHEYLKYTDSSGVHITHHKESSGKDFDFDEHIKAKKRSDIR